MEWEVGVSRYKLLYVEDKCGKIRIPGRKAGKKHDIGEAKL